MSDTFEFNNIPYSDLPGDWSTALKLSWIDCPKLVTSFSSSVMLWSINPNARPSNLIKPEGDQ